MLLEMTPHIENPPLRGGGVYRVIVNGDNPIFIIFAIDTMANKFNASSNASKNGKL